MLHERHRWPWRGEPRPAAYLAGGRARPRPAGALGARLAAAGGHFLVYAATAAALGIWMACPQQLPRTPDHAACARPRRHGAPIGIAIGLAMPMAGLAPFVAGLVIPLSGYVPGFLGRRAPSVRMSRPSCSCCWVPSGSGGEGAAPVAPAQTSNCCPKFGLFGTRAARGPSTRAASGAFDLLRVLRSRGPGGPDDWSDEP